MASIRDQLMTLAAVGVGAFLSFVATVATERFRWRRERDARWDGRRIEAYGAHATSVKTMLQIANRLSAEAGLGSVTQPIFRENGLVELAQAEADRGAAWEQVLLLGDHDTITAGRRWHEAVWELELFARQLKTDPDEWESALTATNNARAAFYASARKDLKINGLAPFSSWPRRPLQRQVVGEHEQAV